MFLLHADVFAVCGWDVTGSFYLSVSTRRLPPTCGNTARGSPSPLTCTGVASLRPGEDNSTTMPGVSIYFKNTQNIDFLHQSDNLTYTLSHTYLVFFASLCKR